MLGGELARRSENLKKEQRQRAEAAQRKAEKERLIQERLQKQRQAHEEELRLKRVAEAAAAEEVSAGFPGTFTTCYILPPPQESSKPVCLTSTLHDLDRSV